MACPRVMITGQQKECTQERFDAFYKPAILKRLGEGASFLLGMADGVDTMARALLEEMKAESVTLYDKKYHEPVPLLPAGWFLVTGFDSYPDRDRAMIRLSDDIIVFLFENAVTSGTWYNLMYFAKEHVAYFGDTVYDADILPGPEDLLTLARCYARDAPYASKSPEIEGCAFVQRGLLCKKS